MYRPNVLVAAAAVFTIGVAFAAQPTSVRADRGDADLQRRAPWAPGTDSLMSSHESSLTILAPPR